MTSLIVSIYLIDDSRRNTQAVSSLPILRETQTITRCKLSSVCLPAYLPNYLLDWGRPSGENCTLYEFADRVVLVVSINTDAAEWNYNLLVAKILPQKT